MALASPPPESEGSMALAQRPQLGRGASRLSSSLMSSGTADGGRHGSLPDRGGVRPVTSQRTSLQDVDEDVLFKNKNKHVAKLLKPGQDSRMVEKADLEDLLTSQKSQRDSFLKLPVTIVYFVLYCMSVLNHEKVSDSSMMQRQLRGMLAGTTFEGVHVTSGHKDLGDIDTPDDWYLYMEEALIPMFINTLDTPEEDRHRVLRYNQLIGGIQIQQVRRRKVLCSTEYPDLGPFPRAGRTNPILANFDCYPWYTESDDCYGPWNTTVREKLRGGFCPDSKRELEAGTGLARRRLAGNASLAGKAAAASSRRLDFVPEGGGKGGSTKGARADPGPEQLYSVYMYEHEGLETALEKLKHLQDNEWIDFNTAWVGVRMFVLNPDLAIFVHVTVHVYFATSGALLPHITAQSFAPDPYQYMSIIAFDIFWLLMLMWLAYVLIRKLHHAAKESSCREFFMDVWVWVDLSTVVVGMVIIILWLIFLDKLVLIKSLAMDVRALQPQTGFTSDDYPVAVAAMHTYLAELSNYLMWMRLTFSWYTIVIALKFLESFSAQPRLAVVTTTIWNAGSELFHFLIVLSIIFFSYVIAGMFIFGRRLWEFSSFGNAVSKCFLMMLGDFDWEELGAEDPTTAMLWFWSYMVVMMLLMLNMLMAIIMDKYTEVKSDAAQNDTITTQIMDMIVEFIRHHTGTKMSTAYVLEKVKEMDHTDVNEDILQDNIEGLSKEQATSLVKKTKEHAKAEMNKGVTMSEAMRMIGWTKIAVQKIGWTLEEILRDERAERKLLKRATDGDRGDSASTPPSSGAMPRHGVVGGGALHSPGEPSSRGDATPPVLRGRQRGGVGVATSSELSEHHGVDRGPPYVDDAEERLDAIERRMGRIEDFMQEALKYTEFRGKDLRNRLAVIEDLIRSQRDAMMVSVDRDVWDREMPRLRDRDRFDESDSGSFGGGFGGNGGGGTTLLAC